MDRGATKEIYLPCEVFPVQLVVAPQEGLSVLESLVLQAVNEGVDNFEELVSIFQIGYRPMLHLVGDMWHNRHLRLDFQTGLIRLTKDAADRLKTERESELAGGQRSSPTVYLMQELVAGAILPQRGALLPFAGGPALPMVFGRGAFRHFPRSVIQEAAESTRELRDEGKSGPKKILALRLPLPENDIDGIRYLRLKLRVSRSSDWAVRLSLLQPEWIDGLLRQTLERRIAQLVEERPDEAFSRMLGNATAGDGGKQTGLDDEFEELRTVIGRLRVTEMLAQDRRDLERKQEELERLAASVSAGVAARNRRRATLRVLGSLDSIDQEARTAIGDARHQVVFSSPAVHWRRFKTFYSVLERALKRQVRVIVLWGLQPEETLETEVLNAFNDLASIGPFHWARHSNRTNCRFVLRDFDLGLFCNVDLLGTARPGTLGLALMVQTYGGGRFGKRGSCRAVVDTLDQVRRTALESDVSDRLLWPEADGLDLPSLPAADEAHLLANVPPLPASRSDQDAGGVTDATLWKAWQDGWLALTDFLEDQLVPQGTIAEFVTGADHRTVLDRLVARCRHRLVIASGELSSNAFDRNLEDALRVAAQRGVSILLCYDRVFRGEAAERAIQSLVAECPGQVTLARQELQGGLLVADEVTMITSANLLGHHGFDQLQSDRRLRRLECGLVAHGPELSSDAVEAVSRTMPQPLPSGLLSLPAEKHGSRPPAAGMFSTRLRELVFDLQRVALNARGTILRRWFEAALTPERAFADLAEAATALAQRELRQAVATCLSVYGGRLDGEERRWQAWLCESLWHDGAFHEAAILLRELDGHAASASLPPVAIARLAVAANQPPRFDEIAGDLDVPDDLEELAAEGLTCLAIPALLRDGLVSAWYLLEGVSRGVRPPLRAWLDAATEYWLQNGRPLPLTALRRAESIEDARKEAAASAERLRTAFRDAKAVGFRFRLGQATWDRLFDTGGLFDRLAGWVEGNDLEAVESWLREFGARRGSAESLLDQTAATILAEHSEFREGTIHSKKRRVCLHRLDVLLAALRDWVGSRRAVVDLGESFRMARAEELCAVLQRSRPEVVRLVEAWEAARAFPAPLGRLLLGTVERILR